MNKLLGFYELKDNGLPSVDWKEFGETTLLDHNLLWTIRSAVEVGNDLNLPRLVGADADSATKFGRELIKKLPQNSLVIYYPFFIAEKSGVMEISSSKIVIEAVKEDLWNLVTHGKRDVTIIINEDNRQVIDDKEFLDNGEIDELLSYTKMLKNKYRDFLLSGKSVFLEWSFAFRSDKEKQKVGDRMLVFYEIRTV